MENKEKTTSTAETVTISRAEYEELKLQNQWLLEQLGLAKKRQFGSSSEKMQEELMEQLALTHNVKRHFIVRFSDTVISVLKRENSRDLFAAKWLRQPSP